MTQTNLERLPEATPEPLPKKRLEIPLIAIVALSLSLAAPVAALVGYFFLHGYLSAFGLNVGFFPRSFQELVLGSFTALLHLAIWLQELLEIKGMVFWIAFVLSIFVYAYFVNVFANALKRWIERVAPILSFKQRINGLGKWIGLFAISSSLPGMCFLVVFLLLLPSTVAYKFGKGAGVDTIKEFSGCNDPQPYKCAKLYDNGTLIAAGLIIEASDKFVAIYDNSTARLLPLTPTSRLEVSLGRSNAE